MKICFATNNLKKIEEVNSALMGTGIHIQSLEEIGCMEELPETGATLEENAVQKARHVFDNYSINCFADDTGLEVAALGGAPGVHSGRYAGAPRNDARNLNLLLEKLAGVKNRKARFRTVIALIISGKEYLFEGIANGQVMEERSGQAGFGYDPVFLPDGYNKTFAQLSMEEKNAISHRGKAIQQLIGFLNTQQ